MTISKIPGVVMRLSGQDYVLAPLKLSQLRELEAELERMPSHVMNPDPAKHLVDGESVIPNPRYEANQTKRLEIIARVVAASLSRNYEDMTPDRAMDLLDASNFMAAYNAALSVSGLVQGEGQAATGSASVGSTDGSPPPTDGPMPRSATTH